jgi:prepilin-type N-terminal cleavage/methylation domain-containing protein
MKTAQRGFSFLELLASMAILSIVMAVVVEGITTMQARNVVETNKLDLTQQTREFMDQIVNDLHQSGFPGLNMFDPLTLNPASGGNPICTQNNSLACGFKSISATELQFEGDVDGTGVSFVDIKLNQPTGGCPCTITRGTIAKPSTTPTFYTQVNNVMNTTVFTAYDSGGGVITLPLSAQGTMNNLAAIGITLYVKSSQPDPKTGQFPTVTMVSTAMVTNKQNF